MNVESDSILLRRMEFFHQYDIEVWLRKEVSVFLASCTHILSLLTVFYLMVSFLCAKFKWVHTF